MTILPRGGVKMAGNHWPAETVLCQGNPPQRYWRSSDCNAGLGGGARYVSPSAVWNSG